MFWGRARGLTCSTLWLNCPSRQLPIQGPSQPLAAPLRASMAVPPVAMRLCLGEVAVPLQEQEVLFHDLHSVCDDMEDGRLEWHLLDLSVGRRPYDMWWLERAFGLRARWWQAHGRKLPVVQEALETIRSGRIRKGSRVRFPKQPHIIVAIRLRGARVFVRNSTNCLTIAFQKVREGIGHYVPQFLHLMGMLKQDVDALQLQLLQQQKKKHAPREPQEPRDHPEEPQEEGRPAPQQADTSDPEAQADDAEEPQDPLAPQDLEDGIRDALLKNLTKREDCRSASYLPASGRVRAKRALDGAEKYFTIKQLTKARKMEGLGHAGSIQLQFDQALVDIEKFLEPEPSAPPAPPAQPEEGAGEAVPESGSDEKDATERVQDH